MAQHQVDQFKTGIWTVKNLLLSLDQLSIPDFSVHTSGLKKI